MRGFAAFLAATVLAALSLSDGWLLKAPYEAKGKYQWKLAITAKTSGEEHHATMDSSLTIAAKSDKEVKAVGSWGNLTVDENAMGDTPEWEFTFAPSGAVSSANDGLDHARMLAPMFFVYPDKEVKVGDKWTTKFKPAKDGQEFTVDYVVAEQTKVSDAEVFKVTGKLVEAGTDGMKGDEVFWIAKDGQVLRYELTLTNWIVPMANDQPVDATIKGELVKPKS